MIDFYSIQESLKTAIEAALPTVRPECVFIEMMDRDLNFSNMPLVNIRLEESSCEITTLPNGYYAITRFSIDITTFDLSEFKIAARLRDDLVKALMLVLRASPTFGNSAVSSSKIGQKLTFAAGTPEQGGGHIAVATFSVATESYVDFP